MKPIPAVKSTETATLSQPTYEAARQPNPGTTAPETAQMLDVSQFQFNTEKNYIYKKNNNMYRN